MKTLLEILTTPNPSSRDEFVLNTAKAIYLRNRLSPGSDDQCVVQALVVNAAWGIYDHGLSVHAVGYLRRRIFHVVRYLRAIQWLQE